MADTARASRNRPLRSNVHPSPRRQPRRCALSTAATVSSPALRHDPLLVRRYPHRQDVQENCSARVSSGSERTCVVLAGRVQFVYTLAVTPSAVADTIVPGVHTDPSPLPSATRRHRSLGIPQLGKSLLPVCGSQLCSSSPPLLHRSIVVTLALAGLLGPGPGRPGCVSPCCVQCRRYSARDTSRGNMDQSREPTKCCPASADRRQSSQSLTACLPSLDCLFRVARQSQVIGLISTDTLVDHIWGGWTGCRLPPSPVPPPSFFFCFFQGCLCRHICTTCPALRIPRSRSDAN